MSELYTGVAGHVAERVHVAVGGVGPWVAEVDFDTAPELSGSVTLVIGPLELRGTVEAGGVEGAQRRVRIVGGGGGWGRELAAKAYHNDARVKARLVAEDAARAAGEQLGTFTPAAERIGADYVREAGPASRVLEDVIGGVPWWVGFDGLTYVGTRPAVAVPPEAYEVLAYDPRNSLVTVAVPDPRTIVVGSVLSERLDAPRTVREFDLTVDRGDLRIVAWCGGGEGSRGRLAGLFRQLVEQATDGQLHGLWRYRVIQQAGDRLNLQAVRRAAGLPDLLPVSMWPGIPGVHCEPTPGAEVLVQFVEGDRTAPVVTHFRGKDGEAFAPVALTLGGYPGSPAARVGDNVEVLLPPAVFSGTIGGTPATGVLTFPLVKTLGTITAGSAKVQIA